ncbi:MAG: UDP-N-acetylmuramate dehydrogenase [Lentimicrobiaceae bacterium]|nr:UDP-N-acetylmuramate dehydrogenase [Lentimicrobiaceae bacterium]
MHNKISLKPHNTFGIEVFAADIIYAYQDEDIIRFLSSSRAKEPFYVLGEGSNILFINDFDGIILKIETKGIQIVSKTDKQVVIKAKAGENWDEFVRYCLANNYCGLENLALIPGKVGSCPIQNIGAYGKEVKDFITKVYAVSVLDKSVQVFENKDCKFGYRTSVFKKENKGQYIITDVEFTLNIGGVPDTSYADIQNELQGTTAITAQNVYDAVSRIRTRKLPDYQVFGNAGSFFKNPIVRVTHFEKLKEKYTDLKSYPVSENECKLSAAQLIELSGWKGKRTGEAGVFPTQPLVLVNYGNATGKDILNLAKQVQNAVYELFNLELEMEVNVV